MLYAFVAPLGYLPCLSNMLQEQALLRAVQRQPPAARAVPSAKSVAPATMRTPKQLDDLLMRLSWTGTDDSSPDGCELSRQIRHATEIACHQAMEAVDVGALCTVLPLARAIVNAPMLEVVDRWAELSNVAP